MNNQNKQNTPKTIFVIGAGSAGLAAGYQLLKKFPDCTVKIFEAQSIHGGRVRQDTKWTGHHIELGGEEMHQANSWYGRKIKSLEHVKWFSDYECTDYYQDPVTNQLVDYEGSQLEKQMEQFEEKLLEFQNKQGESISIKEFIDNHCKDISEEQKYLYNTKYAQDYGTCMERMGAQELGDDLKKYEYFSQADYTFNKSHFQIQNEIFKDVLPLIQYSSPVEEINYLNDKIQVKLVNSSEIQEADKVVICVPVTQLQKNKIKFTPNLEARKINAINQIKMEPGIKIHFKFKNRIWDETAKVIMLKGKISLVWVQSVMASRGFHIISALIFGENAEEFSENKDEFINQLLENLSISLNVDAKEEYEDCLYVDWGKQKYIEGGYTFPIQNEGNCRDIIRESVQNKLFFGGECANQEDYGTIYGAIQSGFNAVDDIVSQL